MKMAARRLIQCVGLIIVMAPLLVAAGSDVGDRAPAFELPGSDGETYRLTDFKGEQVVVLAWFPKAFTGG